MFLKDPNNESLHKSVHEHYHLIFSLCLVLWDYGITNVRGTSLYLANTCESISTLVCRKDGCSDNFTCWKSQV